MAPRAQAPRNRASSLYRTPGGHTVRVASDRPSAMQEQLGHAPITLTMGHLLPSAHETLADRLDAAYDEEANPPENLRELRAGQA